MSRDRRIHCDILTTPRPARVQVADGDDDRDDDGVHDGAHDSAHDGAHDSAHDGAHDSAHDGAHDDVPGVHDGDELLGRRCWCCLPLSWCHLN